MVSLKVRARALVLAIGQCMAGTGRTIGKKGEHTGLNANADHDTQVHATNPPSGPHSRWARFPQPTNNLVPLLLIPACDFDRRITPR